MEKRSIRSDRAFEAMEAEPRDEAAELHEVMGAQTQAPAINGVINGATEQVVRGQEAQQGSSRDITGDLAGPETARALTASYGAVGGADETQPTTSTAPPLRGGTESTREQGERRRLVTTPDADGNLRRGNTAGRGDATSSQMGFLTPRSTPPGPMVQNNWLNGLEVPRWMSRLGSYLSVGQGDLIPSPLAGASSGSSPQPGGPTFVLRSPPRAVRSIRPATPPSSDVSAGAIQAEVQRQLGGILSRLQTAENQNEELRRELDAERDRLRHLQRERIQEERSATPGLTAGLTPGLTTGLTPGLTAGLTPGLTTGAIDGTQDLRASPNLRSGDQPTQRRGPTVSENVFLPQRDPPSQPQRPTDLWGSFEGVGDPVAPPLSSGVPVPSRGPPRPQPNVNDVTAQDPPPLPDQRGFLRSILGRPRSETPPPPRASAAAESPAIEALTRGVQQLQELQAQALQRGQAATSEIIKPGTSTLTTLPTLTTGAEAALQFQDWLEVTTAVMNDISEQSGLWWAEVQRLVDTTYQTWLAATPLERLAVAVPEATGLETNRWTRLNARVAAMLLTSMSEEQRSDMVSRRIANSTTCMMFRLHTLYQPGGSLERQDMLHRLQSPSDYLEKDSIEEVLKILRAWPRWVARCHMVKMAVPDPSVLARGLRQLTQKHLEPSPDAVFRTAMLRTSLRLDGQPTAEQVRSYQKHLQAELENIITSQQTTSTSTTSPQPKVRALEKPTGSPKEKNKEKNTEKTPGQAEPCRYFMKPQGCKRGARCNFSHSMAHLERDVRNKKCLNCGSEAHRQKDCQVGRAGVRNPSSMATSPQKDQRTPKGQDTTAGVASLSTTASGTVSDDGRSTAMSTVQGVPWTLESLVQVAQQVVQAQSSPPREEQSPEKTRPEMKMVTIRDIRVCAANATSSALLDSGATHCLRNAYDKEEWESAEGVLVQLAGENQLTMRMSSTGSLLMPPRSSSAVSGTAASQGQTIVPLGELVRTLGYTLVWSPQQCFIEDGEGMRTKLSTTGGCPHLHEMEALALIARLEERKRERLVNEADATRDRITAAALYMDRGWKEHLYDYVNEGVMDSGLRSVRDAAFLQGVPGECLDGLIQDGLHSEGWKVMKKVDHFTRAQKRYLWTAKKWVVHLFAGDPGHYQVFQLDKGDTAVIELDIHRCKGHDVLNESMWRMLLWGALQGKVDAIIGGPPGRSGLRYQDGSANSKDVKMMKVITRMLWLYTVSTTSRQLPRTGQLRNRPVAFVLEHPSTRATSGCALWDTELWKEFEGEFGMTTISFDQRATGARSTSPTTLGTNVYYLMGLENVGSETEEEGEFEGKWDSSVWSPGLVDAIVLALRFWSRQPRLLPSVAKMTPAQWEKHVQGNHMDYHKDCLTCVMARGTGKRHARVYHPSMFTLTVDMAGPVKPGLDVTSKGTMGKGLKYLMVARYVLPTEYVKAYSGQDPPDDHGMEEVKKTRPEEGDGQDLARPSLLPPHEEEPMVEVSSEDKIVEGDGKELARPSLLPPHEEETIGRQDRVENGLDYDGEELARPSLLPPHEEDPFILDDEPGEQSPLFVDDEPGEQSLRDDLTLDRDELLAQFVGGTREQREHYEDENNSLYQPSEPDGGEDQHQDHGEEEDPGTGTKIPFPDCEPPRSTYLLFARALPNNGTAAVKAVLQELVLYLQSHGLPIYRLHSDKGETYNHAIRSWMRDQGIRATWSEPGVPQGNGQAETTVRWVKDRARSLLLAAKLPTRLWPAAAEAATAIQRAKVLNWSSSLLAPFGAYVHLKQKVFDSSGPRRRERAFESRWTAGYYMGMSTLLEGGHVIFIPESEGKKEKFLHTKHIRPRLIDPGPPRQELQAEEAPKPRRRLVEKTPEMLVEMRPVRKVTTEFEEKIKQRAQDLLEDWDQRGALCLVVEIAESGLFDEVKFGVFRHGGTIGWLRGLIDYPELTKVLTRIVIDYNPEATFTAVWVSRNQSKGVHRDFNNDEQAMNYVIPLQIPKKGGELWVELGTGDKVCGEIIDRYDDKGNRLFGQLYPLRAGCCNVFSPRKTHEVLQWDGVRTVLVAYTPQCMGKMTKEMIVELEQHGFPIPLTQFPEYFVKQEEAQIQAVDLVSDDNIENYDQPSMDQSGYFETDEVEDWELFLGTPGGMVKIGEDILDPGSMVSPAIQKVEVSYTKGVEEILNNLKGPLEVTYTADPREVAEHLHLWEAAIRKEVDGVSVAIKRLLPGSSEKSEWLRRPGAQRLPTKFVYTIKPGDDPQQGDRSTWYKRKARLVVCGNFAATDNADLYSETAPSEAVRAGLVMTRKKGWVIGLIDIIQAFLRTPLDPSRGDPTIVVTPPRLLERLLLLEEGELWGLIRALYGLRQAPALWSAHRDRVLQTLVFDDGMKLTRGRTMTAWWVLKDAKGIVTAVVIIYVDDFMIMGEEQHVRRLAKVIQGAWRTSELSILSPDHPVRFLGMELEVDKDTNDIMVNQRGYIEEILRAHEVNPEAKDRIPLMKELAIFDLMPEDIPPTPEDIALAQRVTGELMWLCHRTRPDISYTCALMSSITLKAPRRCLAIGEKALRYLQATREYKMMIRVDNTNLVLFPDAAFAPNNSRSHTGWLICWSGTPVTWRSGRQTTIALSTAESELQAILDGAVGLLGMEAMLLDLQVSPEVKVVASDSTSALAIGAGTGSWRTRHLRLKSAWIQDMLATGEIKLRHQPGITQPADLLTKALSGQRIRALLELWGIGERRTASTTRRVQMISTQVAAKVLVAMICCILMLGVQAQPPEPTRTIEIDRDLIGILMTLLMVLGGLLCYELLRWGVVELWERAPEPSQRKLRRLKKVKELTTLAIERELQRHSQSSSTPISPLGRDEVQENTPTLRRRRPSVTEEEPYIPHTHTATSSPGPSEGREDTADVFQVCCDTAMMMRCEELRESLRLNHLPTKGRKEELASRLASLMTDTSSPTSPTVKQYKYLLYLWRHNDLSGKVLLTWHNIRTREEASRTIRSWKNR